MKRELLSDRRDLPFPGTVIYQSHSTETHQWRSAGRLDDKTSSLAFPPANQRQAASARAKDEGRTAGQNFLSLSVWISGGRVHTHAHIYTCAEYIHEIGLESELLLLHFPTLRIQQLTLFGCESWGFVIYNQFSALVSPAFTCAFCSLHPALKALAAFLCFIGPVTFPPISSLSLFLCASASSPSLSPSPCVHALQRSIKCAPAVQAVGAVYHGTSSGSPGSTAQHAQRALTSVAQVFSARYWTL